MSEQLVAESEAAIDSLEAEVMILQKERDAERAVRRQLAEALRALVEDVDDEMGWGDDGPTLIVARGVLAASDALDEEEAPR